MRANISFTISDELKGYPETKLALNTESTETLLKEYKLLTKHGFNQIHGRNARQFQNLIADILINRGIIEYTDIFGIIKIKKWTY